MSPCTIWNLSISAERLDIFWTSTRPISDRDLTSEGIPFLSHGTRRRLPNRDLFHIEKFGPPVSHFPTEDFFLRWKILRWEKNFVEEKKQQQYEDMKLRIKYMYEEGDTSALERIVASGSISEMLTQTEYVEKVHTYDRDKLREYAETVQEVEDLKTSLESDMTKLQNLDEEYKTQTAELSSTIESKRAEVSNLDAMIQEAARAAVEAAKKEQEKNNTVNNENTNTPSGGGDNSGGTVTPAPEPTPTPTPDPTPTPTPTPTPEPNYNPSTGNAVVDRAYSWVGKAEYVWGACSPGAFDCSGFVAYCLTGNYARLGTTYIFLGWPQVSNPQPGDVAVNAEHCGIYIGGGQMIHAADYGIGVIVGPVQSGMIYVRY